jgi:uncharacterized protein
MRLPATLLLLAGLAATSLAQDMSRMTTYYVAFLKKGPKWTSENTPEVREINKGHIAHLSNMAKTGKLILVGPFLDGADPTGISVYATATAEEARASAEADPAVKAGRLVVEVRPWMSVKGITAPPPF